MFLLILAAVLYIKRSGRVLRAMGRNGQVRTQQSRTSGAVNLSRYGCFCCPGGSPGVPGRSPKGPRGSPGGPWEASGARGRSVRSLGSVSWTHRYFVSSLKMFKNGKHCETHINKLSKPVQNRYFGVQNHDFWLRNL